MVAFIQEDAPELFDMVIMGEKFCCSESFVRKYLRNNLCWSMRATTRAAQKLPVNHKEILTEAYLREAWVIRNYAIPAELRVNTDQTQTIYQQGVKTTWNEMGAKQVPGIGKEEKRAFTLVPSISASGELLSFQAVYHGSTNQSCPSKDAVGFDEAKKLGFWLEPSGNSSYWSTMKTMKSLVNNIIAPYFERTKIRLGIHQPGQQMSIWKIDCWSVHKSEEFLSWMKTAHPNIIVLFIPGNCTSIFQPLDVGVQRVLKQSIKRTAHSDVVMEVMSQLSEKREEVHLDMTIGTLRDRSLKWLVNTYHDINRPDLIQKVSNGIETYILIPFCFSSNIHSPLKCVGSGTQKKNASSICPKVA